MEKSECIKLKEGVPSPYGHKVSSFGTVTGTGVQKPPGPSSISSSTSASSTTALTFNTGGRSTNNSNSAAFSSSATISTSSPSSKLSHNSSSYNNNHHQQNGRHHQQSTHCTTVSSSSNNNNNGNASSDLNDEVDFDKPPASKKRKKKRKQLKAEKSKPEREGGGGGGKNDSGGGADSKEAGKAGDEEDEEEENNADEEEPEDEENTIVGVSSNRRKKADVDAESVGSPKTPTNTTPAPDVDGCETEGDTTPSRKKSTAAKKKLNSVAKFQIDKKRLEQYVGEGEVLLPVPRARRRLKGGNLGYMVKKGDTVVRYIDKDGMVYNPSDTAYLQNREKGKPYFVCAIQKFNLTKRDTLMVGVKWFFRLSEVPGSVYHHLTLDRELHKKNGEDFYIHDTSIQQRELFSSDATDTLPITSLRGKCKVVQYSDLRSASHFVPCPDHFFYILAYRPDNRRLATTQGEIRVGPSHQARLPECRPGTSPSDMPEKSERFEEIRWRPGRVLDNDLLMYLRAARSIAAFAGMVGGTTDDRCEAEAMDETTVNALDTLHKHNYDTSKSLQALVKGPSVMYVEKKWSEDDVKRFSKGLRHLGKNFFKIRKEHLPHKDTSELVEFYYFWKKSPAANSSRPSSRRHRRQLKRQSPRNSQPDNDVSSGSESGEESEESDNGRDVTPFCQRCFSTSSKDWHSNGKDGGFLCTKCRLSYKKYGEECQGGLESPTARDNSNNSRTVSPDQYLFKPVPEEEESTTPSKHNMRTRRSNNSSSKKKDNNTSSPDPEGSNLANTVSNNNSTTTANSSSNSTNSKGVSKSPNNSITVEKDGKKSKSQETVTSKAKKRRAGGEDSTSAKKKKDQSDSESGTESSSVSGAEDRGNEADSDENNPEELSSSSRPSSRSSVERGFKPLQPQPTTPGVQTIIPTSSSASALGSQAVGKSEGSTPVTSSNLPDNFVSGSTPAKPQIGVRPAGQLYPPYLHVPPLTSPSGLHPLSTLAPTTQALPQATVGGLATATTLSSAPILSLSSGTSTSSSLSSSGIPHHLKLGQHPSQLTSFKPGLGHISSVGVVPPGLVPPPGIGSGTPASLASPLVVPTPSRASSTGTFIPHTDPHLVSSASTAGNSSAITTAAFSSSSSSSSSSSGKTGTQSAEIPTTSSGPLAPTQLPPSALTAGLSGIPLSAAGHPATYGYQHPHHPLHHLYQQQQHQLRMHEQNSSSSAVSTGSGNSDEQQDKKPILPPSGAFLPPGAAALGFPHQYHPYFYAGQPHLPPHLHPASVAMAVAASSSGAGPHPAPPPPIPSLVPIKKEPPHSPPPPLKPSDSSKSADVSASSALSTVSSATSSSLLTASSGLLRPHPDALGGKLGLGFPPQAGLIPTAGPTIPPPPLTGIGSSEHSREMVSGIKTEDGSLPPASKTEPYIKDTHRGSGLMHHPTSASPHRPESLPSSLIQQQRESRMDNNLSVLKESRDMGLVGVGINPPPASATSSSSTAPLPPHHPASLLKDDPRSAIPLQAAFQPYSQFSHPHHPQLHPATSSAGLVPPPHHLAGSSVLQVPQPHLPGPSTSSSSDHHLHHQQQHESAQRDIKREPITVEDADAEEEDDGIPGSTSPGPTNSCNHEFLKTNTAIFMKLVDRGERNQCSRTDFIFRPLPDSNLAKQRERARKSSHSSSSVVKEEKKRVDTPPRAMSVSEGQKSSSSNNMGSSSSSSHRDHQPSSISVSGSSSVGLPVSFAERHTPRPFADTPALRQLHEYARPHVYGQDLTRPPYSMAGLAGPPPHHHPSAAQMEQHLMSYRLGMYPPGSRERLELELERDKRERDAREREMRERELRDMELREKMKQDLELKPGLERLLPHGAPGASQLAHDPSWLDLQRRMAAFPPGSLGPLGPHGGLAAAGGAPHPAGVYPPVSLAGDPLAKERERLERLGLPQLAADMSYASAVERLSQERQAAVAERAERERLGLAALASADPVARLAVAAQAQAQAQAQATQHAHTHTHAHSHTHLHLHQQEVAAHAQAVAHAQAHGLAPPAFTPHALAAHLYSAAASHHPLAGGGPPPGADPLAGGPGPSGSVPSSSANPIPGVLPPGIPHPLLAGSAGSREELLQRELYSRGAPFLDPALAHQLSAQAAAHEALQRQIALERERFGSSGHLPH